MSVTRLPLRLDCVGPDIEKFAANPRRLVPRQQPSFKPTLGPRRPCPPEEIRKVPLSHASGRDVACALVDILLKRTEFFRLLQQISDCRFSKLFWQKIECGGGFFGRVRHQLRTCQTSAHFSTTPPCVKLKVPSNPERRLARRYLAPSCADRRSIDPDQHDLRRDPEAERHNAATEPARDDDITSLLHVAVRKPVAVA
jgi:hypothetical protein